ncbi:MAG: MmcQ/YjbR family DNA-binding protein [Saprospiraceae bacterium]
MITSETVRQLALALPETMEQPHFEKNAFRINGKIFATHSAEKQQVVVKLNEVDQSVFSAMGKGSCYPVAGGWGKQGWTAIELSSAEEVFLQDALKTAWLTVAPPKLVTKYFPG